MAKRCEAEICVARKIFLPSLGETGRTGTEVVRPDNGKMVSEIDLLTAQVTYHQTSTANYCGTVKANWAADGTTSSNMEIRS